MNPQSSRMKYHFQRFIERLSHLIWFFFFSLILQQIATVSFIYHSLSSFSVIDWALFLEFSVKALMKAVPYALLFWLLASIPSNTTIRKGIIGLLTLLSTIIFGVELYLISRYGMPYSTEALTILFSTNSAEASEYLSTIQATGLLAIAVLLGGICLLWYMLRRGTAYIHTYIHKLTAGLVACLLLFSIGITIYSAPRTLSKVLHNGGAFDQAISPYDRLIWNSYAIAVDTRRIEEFLAQVDQIPINVQVAESAPTIEHVVLILGETLRRDYMSLYGFPLPTTPQLDSLYQSGQLLRFTDAVSPTPNTAGSVPKYLTFDRNDKEGNNPWYHYPSLSKTLEQAGYYTAWISNQESQGAFINVINTIAHLCQYVKYVNQRGIDSELNNYTQYYDESVLPALLHTSSKEVEKPKLFEVVHLMGSHARYYKRYPQAWAKFSASDVPRELKEDYKKEVAQYINSVYYNDWVVSQIIQRYSDKNSLIIYVSDHGEVLYDDPRNPTYIDHAMTKGGTSVPLIVYMSQKAKQLNPGLYERLSTYVNRPIMLDLLTHSVTDLLGIYTNHSDPKLSFFSEEYDSSRKRIVEGIGEKILYEDMP